MRGKVPRSSVILDCVRITPAYAGKRVPKIPRTQRKRDHPRLCGEKTMGIAKDAMSTGITPAYAGKSFAEWIDEQGEEDHPRLCGEKILVFHGAKLFLGSPPAYAGKSRKHGTKDCPKWDHPRLCGGKRSVCIGKDYGSPGSPPPMRGKVLFIHLSEIVLRITPAYAGKSTLISFHSCSFRGSPPPMRGKD